VGVGVGDRDAAAFEEPVQAIQGAVVELPLEPLERRVELLGAGR
jgi:hypothetical protein